MGTHWIASSGACYCRAGIAAQSSLTMIPSLYNTDLLGTCVGFIALSSTYNTASSVPCQSVFFPPTGCLGIDGTPCSAATVLVPLFLF